MREKTYKKENFQNEMKRRNPYSDFGLVIAASVFVCIFMKCLLFGFTWVSIIWLVLSLGYFYVSWRYPSDGRLVKHSTTLYLVLSVVAVVCIALFDKKARPVMHAFEGTGDTIQDVQIVDEGPLVTMYETLPDDTAHQDTAVLDEGLVLPDSIVLEDGTPLPSGDSIPEGVL